MTPAFAMTLHAAQGQTFSKGAIVDLCIGGSSSTMSSYVAITRVERREDLLIYNLFLCISSTKARSLEWSCCFVFGVTMKPLIGKQSKPNTCRPRSVGRANV